MQQTWWRHFRFLLLLFNCGVVISNLIPPWLEIVKDQDSIREIAFQKTSELVTFDNPKLIFATLENFWISMRGLALLLVFFSQTVTLVILTHVFMKNAVKTSSAEFHKTQKTLLRAIYLQISISFCLIFIPELAAIVVRLFANSIQEAANLTNLFLSIHGASGTIVMLYLYRPYRTFCRKLLNYAICCRKNNKQESGRIYKSRNKEPQIQYFLINDAETIYFQAVFRASSVGLAQANRY
ncbi:hypothetical protein GCK72_019687 [Caenorhabditis remanei]|uniref:G-protein coupled receptors family 1 profile domain-containing protein n=1 Tax=Caenorhabditis remanei TaxID=31234 RepID=A0A6A5GEX1_CAERE|nr:hypothetical protein GCK72_019687 [Caenorhabditis remanei]KAF1753131.1 hypothetical protein GCK72_019687 [Caenorhabditis remanei]